MFGWLIAGLLAGAAIVWSAHREGLAAKQIAVLLIGCTVALLVGAKILYLFEATPAWSMRALWSEQVRLPGGIFVLLLISPLLPRIGRASAWGAADLLAPALGLLILGTRIGCFLQGCCYGRPSELPWALPFPRGSEAHAWQIEQGLVHASAMHSLPVQPLQLYFAIVGAVLFLVLVEYQAHRRYEGEVALLFAVAYFWSTYWLELLRAQPHPLTWQFSLIAAAVATSALLYVEVRRRLAPRAAPIESR